MRLTEHLKNENRYGIKGSDGRKYKMTSFSDADGRVAELCDSVNAITNKLGQLEDIEEELGIELITLIKALENGIWVKSKRNGIEYGKSVLIGNTFIHCSVYSTKYANNRGRSYKTMNIKDYGKTWALTKEELE